MLPRALPFLAIPSGNGEVHYQNGSARVLLRHLRGARANWALVGRVCRFDGLAGLVGRGSEVKCRASEVEGDV